MMIKLAPMLMLGAILLLAGAHLSMAAQANQLAGLRGVSLGNCLYKGRTQEACDECCRSTGKDGGQLMQWHSGPVCSCHWAPSPAGPVERS